MRRFCWMLHGCMWWERLFVALTFRVWLSVECTGNGHGPLEGLHSTAMGPPTHTQGSPRLSCFVSALLPRPVPVTPGQHLLCASLITWGGGDDRRPVSSSHTPSLDPTPLLCEAKLSEAKLWPCPTPSLPPSPSPQAHTPLQPLGGPVHRRPHQGAWGVGGPGESKAPRQEEHRGEERYVRAAEGPARVPVTRQGHRRRGQGKRAPTQDPPALDDHPSWCVPLCLVM
jgi:hypothetical protein